MIGVPELNKNKKQMAVCGLMHMKLRILESKKFQHHCFRSLPNKCLLLSCPQVHPEPTAPEGAEV